MIDQNNCPPGFKAVDRHNYCEGCHFEDGIACTRNASGYIFLCVKDRRPDKHDVIFIIDNDSIKPKEKFK